MDQFNGIKVGELYSWTMANTDYPPPIQLFWCIDISKPRKYGKTGKMFANITYLWNGKHHKVRTVEGSKSSLVPLN